MKERVSGRQATYVAMGVLLGTVFLPIAQVLAASSGRDAWMVVLPGYLVSFPFVYLALYAYLKAPEKDLLQSARRLLGPWLGYPLILFFAAGTAWFSGLLLRQGGELFARSLMQETPLSVFLIGILLMEVLIVYSGLEVFARGNEIIMLPILLSLLLLVLFNIPKAELGYLKPYLYNGLSPLYKGFFVTVTYGFEYIVFLWIFLPVVNKPHEVIRSSLKGYLIVGLVLTGLTVMTYCVFSPEETVRLYYGALSLARMSEVGNLFHGMEAFFIVFWLGANLIKASAFFFCAYHAIQAVIPFRRSLFSVALFSPVLLAVAYLPQHGGDIVSMLNVADRCFIVPLGSAGTLLLAAAAYLRTRRRR